MLSCPNKSGVLYKELLQLNDGNEFLATYMHSVVSELQDKGLISQKRYRTAKGNLLYHIPKIMTELSIGKAMTSTKSPYQINIAKKDELDKYIKDNGIEFINPKISSTGDAIWVLFNKIKFKDYSEQEEIDEVISELSDEEKSEQLRLEQEEAEDRDLRIAQPVNRIEQSINNQSNIKQGVEELFDSNFLIFVKAKNAEEVITKLINNNVIEKKCS
jgi:hypothetical protein